MSKVSAWPSVETASIWPPPPGTTLQRFGIWKPANQSPPLEEETINLYETDETNCVEFTKRLHIGGTAGHNCHHRRIGLFTAGCRQQGQAKGDGNDVREQPAPMGTCSKPLHQREQRPPPVRDLLESRREREQLPWPALSLSGKVAIQLQEGFHHGGIALRLAAERSARCAQRAQNQLWHASSQFRELHERRSQHGPPHISTGAIANSPDR